MTAVLGGMSTVVASYLARTRGTNEPELSITRVKDLEKFIRECDAFIMDYGHLTGDSDGELNKELDRLRKRFEDLLGNANGCGFFCFFVFCLTVNPDLIFFGSGRESCHLCKRPRVF